jgi:arylsulfatase A-like enzyme
MTIVNGISRIGFMSGGHAARWKDEEMADVFSAKAIAFLERNKGRPFFLYLATHDIHVPRVPHSRFAGKTPMGPRGDVIAELDGTVGRVLDGLDRLGLARSTLVVFSSDNGPVVDDGYRDDAVLKLGEHRPAGPWRGGKYSKFEAGTRVPLIVRWPESVMPGVSGALVCQVDFPATFAALTGGRLGEADAPDSIDVLPALLGQSQVGRDHLVEQGRGLALREGPWKLIPPSDGAPFSRETGIETGNDLRVQLYDLAADPGEARNLAADQPQRVEAMTKRLEQIRSAGPSRR